jgi:hypothetical protein
MFWCATSIQRQYIPHVKPCSCCVIFAVSRIKGFSTNICFTGWDCQSHAQPPTWRTRVSLFVWVINFEQSGTWCNNKSVTTASTTLRIIWPHKPHHYIKVGISSVECNSYKNVSAVTNTQNKTLNFRRFFKWNSSPEEGTNENICIIAAYISDTNLLKQNIYQLTQKIKIIYIKKFHRTQLLIGKIAGRAPSLPFIPWHLPYNWGKITEKPQSGMNTLNTQSTISNFFHILLFF